MKSKTGSFFICTGLLLIASALCLVGFNIWEEQQVKITATETAEKLESHLAMEKVSNQNPPGLEGAEPEITVPDYIQTPEMEMPTKSIDGWDYVGMVEIPVLELELPVISQWSYPALKMAPCRYSGSAYTDDLILLAHNYQSHFGNIHQLQSGDVVSVTDMNGNEFFYEVMLKETLEPTAIEEMQSGDWDLTLFTCTVGGSYRVTVRCERLENWDFRAN